MPNSDAKPAKFTRLRALLFLLATLATGAGIIVAMTWWVIGSAPRTQAVAVAEGITVEEFATLPDDDAYPAALAVAEDGTLYTGSYQSGALWSINPEGDVREILGVRDLVGSITGLDVGPDGALYILDRIAPLDAKGAVVWRYLQGELEFLFEFQHEDFAGGVLPDDIAVDEAGRIYISDRLGHVLLYDESGRPLGQYGEAYWWFAPCSDQCETTGLAYDPTNDDLLIAFAAGDEIYRVSSSDSDPGDMTALLRQSAEPSDFGIDGITTGPYGEVYVALLNRNRVARIEDGELTMLAKDFRGASDLAYDAARDRLYVSNWNQFSLVFGTGPQLPFAIDVIRLSPVNE